MSAAPNVVLDAAQVGRSLKRIAMEIAERNGGADNVVLVGIVRRGATLAERIAVELRANGRREVPVGTLDITLYRDDLQTIGPRPIVGATDLPRSIDGARVVIVDDVLYTGRTVRAALEKLVAELGINYLLTYMFLGTMSLADALRSLALFSTEVMPHLEKL